MNPTLIAQIAAAITYAACGIVVDGGIDDSAAAIGVTPDGYVTFGSYVFLVVDKFTMASQDKSRFENLATYLDVSTVTGYVSVTAYQLQPVRNDDIAEASTDGATL